MVNQQLNYYAANKNINYEDYGGIVNFYDMLMKIEKYKIVHTLCNGAKI